MKTTEADIHETTNMRNNKSTCVTVYCNEVATIVDSVGVGRCPRHHALVHVPPGRVTNNHTITWAWEKEGCVAGRINRSHFSAVWIVHVMKGGEWL